MSKVDKFMEGYDSGRIAAARDLYARELAKLGLTKRQLREERENLDACIITERRRACDE